MSFLPGISCNSHISTTFQNMEILLSSIFLDNLSDAIMLNIGKVTNSSE